MDILDCIEQKRSVRTYTEQPISRETITRLIALGTQAATGSNAQPWGFIVIQDKEEIEQMSEATKKYLLDNLAAFPYLQHYEGGLSSPRYSVFNRAGTLLAIYGDTSSHWYKYDCSMAAGNIMLAAHSMNIGTCWIGFAEHTMNTQEFKAKYGVPEHYDLVCPMSMGYIPHPMPISERKPAVVFNW